MLSSAAIRPDKQLPSQSATKTHEPSSVVASGLKLQAVSSLHPATPQSPKRPLALPPSANILPSESVIDQLFSSGHESVAA